VSKFVCNRFYTMSLVASEGFSEEWRESGCTTKTREELWILNNREDRGVWVIHEIQGMILLR